MGEDLAEAPPPPPPSTETLQTFPNEPEKSRLIRLPRIKFDHDWRKYAAVKLSSEFDSEGNAFINKISARVFHGIAKIKASFQRSGSGEIQSPQLGFVTKYLSILYDHEDRNALVTASADLSQRLQLKLLTDVKVCLWLIFIIFAEKIANAAVHFSLVVFPWEFSFARVQMRKGL